MKKNHPNKLVKCLVVLWLCMVGLPAFSQLPSGIIWNKAVGCREATQEHGFGVEGEGECVKICENSKVTYTLVGGNPQDWINVNWNISGGNLLGSSGQNAIVDWGNQGWGNILVEIETKEGIFIREVCVEIIAGPHALFNIAPNMLPPSGIIEVCRGEEIYFQNLSTTNGGSLPVSYNWIFSDDNTSSPDFEPVHVFQNSGTYTVKLTVTNACNCSASTQLQVHVLDLGFQIQCNSIVCEDAVETYTVSSSDSGTSSECDQYQWEVEGGQILSQNSQSVDVQWNNVDKDGFGYVTFIPIDCNTGCAEPVTIKVPVITNDVGIDGPAQICQGEQFLYAIPQWPDTEVVWEVIQPSSGYSLFDSDQPNEIIFRGNNPGHYLLKATYTNALMECGGTAYKEIEVIPKVSILGPARLCEGESGHFVTDGSYVNWRLEGPSGLQTGNGYTFDYTFPIPGIYTLSSGAGNYCPNQVHTIYVDTTPSSPTGIDGPLEACLDQPVSYSVTGSEGTTYWAVENGVFAGSDSGEAVNVIFDASTGGPYLVKAWNERNGCVSEITDITISPLTVDFAVSGAQTVCSSTYEMYSVNYHEGDKYSWSITPDYLGSVVTTPQEDEVEILWNNVTTPTVATLKVEIEKCGGIHTETYPVTVQNAPPLTITAPGSVCRDEQVSFGISGLDSWNSIIWDFGDGTTATDTKSPDHQYTALKANNINYTVTLTVKGANGCLNPATVSFSIQVMSAPVASLSPAVTEAYCSQTELNNAPPTFTLTVDNNYAAATDIDWFHNGNPITGIPPLTYSITPNDFGNYHAVVSSADGCSASTNTVQVRQDDCGSNENCIPNVSINTLSAQLDDCQVGSASVSYTGTPIDYEWQVSGTASVTSETINTVDFSFNHAGTYVIRYIAVYDGVDDNDNPCTASISKTTELIVPYEAILLYSVKCGSSGTYDLTLFDASNYFPGISDQNLNLDFIVNGVSQGSGTNGQLNISLPPGQHTLELEVSLPGFDPCIATIPVNLPNMPTVQINAPSAACAGMPVPFSATVSPPGVVDYEWSFDDFAENSLPDPERVFNAGSYSVSLTVTNIYGCQATATYPIQIDDNNMDGELQLTPPTACYGEPVNIAYFPNEETTPVDTFYWVHEQDTIQTTGVGNITVTEPGEYILAGESAGGCSDPNITSIQVIYQETPVARITGLEEVCAEDTFRLNALPKRDNYNYTWKKDGQTLSAWNNEPVIDQSIDQPGSYDYEVIITAPSGCSDTAAFTVNVFPNPVDPSVNMQILSCNPYTVQLNAANPDSGTFVWSDGQEGSTIKVNYGGPYRVTFFNQYGCSSSYELDVPPNPEAYIWVHPEGCYFTCQRIASSSYLSGPSLPFQHWEWKLNGNPINSGSGMVPNQTFAGNGLYTLTLDNGQCSITSRGMEWGVPPRGCEECNLNFQIGGIQTQYDMYGNCYYIISINFINPGPPTTFTLSNQSGNGIIVPAGGTLPGGGSPHQFEFYPDAGFSGGTVNLRLLAKILHQPETCFFDFSFNLPSCSPTSRPDGEKNNIAGNAELSVSPNPNKGNLLVNYRLEALGEGNYNIFIYDLYGHPVMKKEVRALSGSWNVNLNGYANGTYLLVLRKEGKVLSHQKIILDN